MRPTVTRDTTYVSTILWKRTAACNVIYKRGVTRFIGCPGAASPASCELALTLKNEDWLAFCLAASA